MLFHSQIFLLLFLPVAVAVYYGLAARGRSGVWWLAAASFVLAGVFGAMSAGEFDNLQKGCPTRVDCDRDLKKFQDSGRSQQTIANVSLAVGLAALTVGTVLFVMSLDSERETQLSLHPTGLELRGRL